MVICKLPNAGLGNQLFPLMRAYTFAYLNKLPVMVLNYHQIKPGPWIRGEKNKRNYKGFFVFEKNIISLGWDNLKLKSIYKTAIIEPEIKVIETDKAIANSFLFKEIPHYSSRFNGLKENRDLVIQLLRKLVKPENKEKLNQLTDPVIGVHIRMGDFRKLKEGEEFGKMGTVRTPEDYFINTINDIRKLHGSELPVSVFTDGLKKELPGLFKLKNITLIEGNKDLVDLLLLSRSKIIVTSASSTFSYWAAFISDAAIIMHPGYTGIKIRPENVWNAMYEGAFDGRNNQLIKFIKSIEK